MDILSKFATVEVKSIQRITDADQKYCTAQQAAYEAARSTLSELNFFWEDALRTQKQILSDTDTSSNHYLTDYDRLNISSEKIQSQYNKLHTTLIMQLVYYFNHLYNISLSYMDIVEKLCPVELRPPVLKTLTVIALKEPIRQSYLKDLRGSNAYEHVAELLEQGLISRSKDKNGRSFNIRTTKKFQEYFKLKGDIKALVKKLNTQAFSLALNQHLVLIALLTS